MHVTKTSETQSQTEQLEPAASSGPSRKSILALSVFALGLNAIAAVYTLSPSDFALPNVTNLAELFPHQKASDTSSDTVVTASFDVASPNLGSLDEQLSQQQASAPKPDPVIAALRDIRLAQQQHVASLQENSSSLQQNAALLRQDSTTLGLLRQSITDEQVDVKKISAQIKDEHVDVKKMSAQISTLLAKVDSLQNAIAPEITSSISKGRARNRLTGVMRKRMARHLKPVGPVSIGGARLSFPATISTPEG
jgi:hypothetical protein